MKKKTKIIITVSIILVIILAIIISIVVVSKLSENKYSKNEEFISEDEVLDINLNNIEGKYSNVVISDFETAKQSINDVKGKIGIASVENELEDKKENKTSKYKDTYTFKQVYNGVEVYDGELIVYADKEGNASGIINNYKNLENVNSTPKNSSSDLEKVIKEECGENIKIVNTKTIFYPINENEYTFAYEYEVELFEGALGDITEKIIVNDNTGEIITKISSIDYYTEDELNYFLEDNKYTLQDDTRNIIINKPSSNKVHFGETTFLLYSWNQGEEIDEDTKNAVDYITTLQKCYDYYVDKFDYYSITGNGKHSDGTPVVLNMITNMKEYKFDGNQDKNFSNNAAFVSPSIFFLGDNDLYTTNVEVLGHEYTHGVLRYQTDLEFSEDNKEAKALSEAYADIMGMCIEAYYKNSDRIDGYINSSQGRDIKNSELKYSKKYLEKHEEHENSIMLSRVGYMMSAYLTTEELESVWYESMKYIGSIPTFSRCYYGIVMASREIGLSEEKQQAIKNTFEDLGFGVITIYDDDKILEEENKENEQEPNETTNESGNTTNTIKENNTTNQNDISSKNNTSGGSESSTTNNDNKNQEGEKQISIEQAVNLVDKEFGDYKSVNVDYEYAFSVTYNNKRYYAIYACASDNYMYHGGEWLEEMDDGRFYAGTYYVSSTYTESKVHVGLNNRDLDKYKEGDNVGYFLQSFHLSVD